MATNNAVNIQSAGLVKYDGSSTFSAVTVTQYYALVGSSSNGITSVGLTNGQLLIGSTGAAPLAGTLTPGTGVTIVNAANSITISSAGGGLTWTTVTGTSQQAATNNGYIANNAGLVTVTLPTTANLGDVIVVTGINNATGWKVAQNASQQIFLGTSSTTSGTGGSLASTNTRDSVELTCVVSGSSTVYNVTGCVGNITVV